MLLYALMGGLLVVLIVLLLLTYRKLKIERTLRRKETNRLIAILDSVKAPVTVTDKNMCWTFVNKAVEQFLGVKRENIMGKKCSNWNAHICNTENCGITRLRNGHSETYFDQHGGSYHVLVSYLYDEKGEVDGHVEVVRDITELKKMAKSQAEAENASRAKTAFLAKVSHEIRTPMNAILGITEIQLQNELPPNLRSALDKIYNSGYFLLNIINDILDLSKIEAGKLELAPVKYDIASLISDCVHLNIIRFDNKPIEVKLQVDETIPAILFGDELRIKQILNNLLSNAFKYTDKGEITLSVTVEYPKQKELSQITLVFRVSDTGQGMTKEQVDRLFDEYTRFNAEANRTTEGTGLGMSITRHLIKMMDGEISVESKLGKGSVFTVRLPQGYVGGGLMGRDLAESLQQLNMSRASQRENAPQIVREYMPYGRVLVVDDVETNLYVARGLLAPYGLSMETASSGYEVIEKIKNGATFDIIFMDHFMPKMDGVETTKIIRDLGYTHPIIALTANALEGQAEMFQSHGLNGFISKPIDIRQLNSILNQLIRDTYPPEVIEAARRQKDELQKISPGIALRLANNQLAEVFIRDAEKTIIILEAIHIKQDSCEDEDIQTYIINVHAMKSALANIGELELSDFAGRLEEAGRVVDIAMLSAETPVFLEKLRAVVQKIKPTETGSDVPITAEDEAYLREQLAALQAACKEYDRKAAKDVLAVLREKTWPQSTKELLDTIGEHLLHSEFDEAAQLVNEQLN